MENARALVAANAGGPHSCRRMTTPWIAFTREVSQSIVDCELTHLSRTPIRVEVARAQHRGFERMLTSLGCEIRRVAPAPDHPDAVFVEDTAVVFDELAVITRPGAASRRRETIEVANVLGALRPLARITAPGTLDGGDVLVIGRTVFVGETTRTNEAGISQLAAFLAPHGYVVRSIPLNDCLHLKSAVTALDDRTVLLNPQWVRAAEFAGYRILMVEASEPAAANVLRIGNALLTSSSYPRTLELLRAEGFTPHTVDTSELAKAEGAVTCCALIVRR